MDDKLSNFLLNEEISVKKLVIRINKGRDVEGMFATRNKTR